MIDTAFSFETFVQATR